MKFFPSGYKDATYEARRARAYYSLRPYPDFGFKDWRTEVRGALPLCRPFVRHITNKSATWLFGRGLEFACDIDGMSEIVNSVWEQNRMNQKMVASARIAGIAGSLGIKFSYDGSAKNPINIQVLNGTEHVIWYYDPHDIDTLLMARVQYPYMNPEDGKYYWHREDWTAETLTMYEPLPAKEEASARFSRVADIDESAKWNISGQETNLFGVIPIVQVRNIETGGCWGVGDMWGLWPLIDQYNFTCDMENKHNQKALWPKELFIDLQLEDDASVMQSVGQQVSLKSDSDGKEGKYLMSEIKGDFRAHLDRFSKELLQSIYDAAGGVQIRPETITNKGAMTQAVMTQLYAPLIETTEEKRDAYGENGICKFFEVMAIGLQNMGVKNWQPCDVKAQWPEFFELTEEELSSLVNRKVALIGAGLASPERTVKEIARAEGVDDAEEIWADVKSVRVEPDPERVRDSENGGNNNEEDEPSES